jgi:hypothetical protein
MVRKLFAGVNVILRISSSELKRRLTIKSAGHATYLMSGLGSYQDLARTRWTFLAEIPGRFKRC